MSRVDSARIAARKSEDAAKAAGDKKPGTIGSVAASDAFFPFADGLEALVEAGDWLNENNSADVEIRATFKVYCADEVLESSFSGKVKPNHIEGMGTILDILSA